MERRATFPDYLAQIQFVGDIWHKRGEQVSPLARMTSSARLRKIYPPLLTGGTIWEEINITLTYSLPTKCHTRAFVLVACERFTVKSDVFQDVYHGSHCVQLG